MHGVARASDLGGAHAGSAVSDADAVKPRLEIGDYLSIGCRTPWRDACLAVAVKVRDYSSLGCEWIDHETVGGDGSTDRRARRAACSASSSVGQTGSVSSGRSCWAFCRANLVSSYRGVPTFLAADTPGWSANTQKHLSLLIKDTSPFPYLCDVRAERMEAENAARWSAPGRSGDPFAV